jgi:uncharacterized protein YqgC (DUF456 family)
LSSKSFGGILVLFAVERGVLWEGGRMETVFVLLAFLLLLGGVAGVFFPLVPSPLISWLGFLVCYWGWTGGPVTGGWLLGTTVPVLLAHGFEFVGSYFGARWFKATWRGGAGALLGGVVGPLVCFFLIPGAGVFLGVVLGPFVGALIGELLGKRKWAEAAKVGLGTVVGNLAAMLVKLSVASSLLAAFAALVAYQLWVGH